MATRTLLFDLARLDGVDTTPYRAQVQVHLLRPQQDNETTITTTPLPVAVDGPTRVDVPVTAPGNALVIQWPPGASQAYTTYHLIPPGDGDLLAATLPLVDRATLAPTAHPEAAWWEAVKDLAGGGPAPSLAVDNGDGTIDLMIGD